MNRCTLEAGAIIFYEKFAGYEGLKDRFFVVAANESPSVHCLTTTTRLHAETNPRLATEFCAIDDGECCLPKRCFVDFRQIYTFDDIQMSSYLRSKRVKEIGRLPAEIIGRIEAALRGSRILSEAEKEPLLEGLRSAMGLS